MSLKPRDFNVGVRDLLGVLVPGAILAYTVLPLSPLIFGAQRLFPSAGGDAVTGIVFLVACYVFGHTLDSIGSMLLNPLYERTYRNLLLLPPTSKKKRFTRRLYLAWSLADEDAHDELRTAAAAAARRQINRLRIEGAEDLVRNMLPDWAQSTVVLRGPAGASEVDALQAASKLFRSLAVLSAALLITAGVATAFETLRSRFFGPLAAYVVVAAVGTVAFTLRFMQLRWIATRRIYEYYLISLGSPAVRRKLSVSHDPAEGRLGL